MSQQNITIVGAGLVGICSALALQNKGYQVTLVDRDPPASGASAGNAGVVSPWSCIPRSMPGVARQIPRWLLDPSGPVSLRIGYAAKFLPWAVKFLNAGKSENLAAIANAMNSLNRPNRDLYRELLKGTGGEYLLVDSWYIHAYHNAASTDPNLLGWKMRAERDVPMQRLDSTALHDLEPNLSSNYKSAVILKGQARALDPGAVGRTLFDKAIAQGAEFKSANVQALSPAANSNTGWQIACADGITFKAEKLLLAAGAWSAKLLQPLGIKLPLEAERGYHMVFTDPGLSLQHSIMDGENKFVVSSMLAGVRCAGTAEFAGLDRAPDYRRSQIFKQLVKQLLPKINTEHSTEWMGSRPSFPDSLPCIDKINAPHELFLAFGHSHYGFGMSPKTGRVVAELVHGEPSSVDIKAFSANRF